MMLKSGGRTTAIPIALAFVLTLGCTPKSSGSHVQNIYDQDESSNANGNARRHRASEAEANWTVSAACASSILLDESHVLTAKHCAPKVGDTYTSGIRVLAGEAPDLVVTEVLESNEDFDYAIVAVDWTRPMPSAQKFPPYIAIDPTELLMSDEAGNGDYIFTVGFPNDKDKIWPATYAEGQAKRMVESFMAIDIGVINGNSGGGILKKDNNMLVGIVVRGPANYLEKGWNKNDILDPELWNYATPTWDIYKISPLLKKIFPKGRNVNLGSTFAPRTKLYIAVESSGTETFLWVAGGIETASIVLCPGAVATCKTSGSNFEKLPFKEQRYDRRFFRSSKSKALNKASYSLAAYDAVGNLLAKRRVTIKKKD